MSRKNLEGKKIFELTEANLSGQIQSGPEYELTELKKDFAVLGRYMSESENQMGLPEDFLDFENEDGENIGIGEQFNAMSSTIDTIAASSILKNEELIAAFWKDMAQLLDKYEQYRKQIESSHLKEDAPQMTTFRYINRRMEDIEKRLPELVKFVSSNDLLKRFAENYGKGKEDAEVTRVYTEIGLNGHRPSLHECLTMQPEKMPAEKLLDHLIWLNNNLYAHDEAVRAKKVQGEEDELHDPAQDNSVYGYAYRRLITYMSRCSAEKQAEFVIAMQKLNLALQDRVYTKYQNILAEIGDDPDQENIAKLALAEVPEYQALSLNLNLSGKLPMVSTNLELTFREFKVDGKNPLLRDKDKQIVLKLMGGAVENQIRKYENDTEDLEKVIAANGIKERLLAAHVRQVNNGSLEADIRTRIAETYNAIMTDKREASDSFNDMKRALFELLKLSPENVKDSVNYFGKLAEAQIRVQAYLDAHKGHRFSEQGKDRVVWAKRMKAQLAELAKDPAVVKLYDDYRRRVIRQSMEKIRTTISAMEDKDPGKRPENPGKALRTAYAALLFQQQKLKDHSILNMQEEEAEFKKFVKSKALLMVFKTKSVYMLKKLAEEPEAEAELKTELKAQNPNATLSEKLDRIRRKLAGKSGLSAENEKLSGQKIDKELEKYRGYACIDKIPRENPVAHGTLGDKYISLIQAEKLLGNSQFFDDFTDPEACTHIAGIQSNEGRLRLSATRQAYATMAVGYLLGKGHSFEEIMDPFRLHKEKMEAGAAILKAFHDCKDDKDYAAFCAPLFYKTLEASVDQVKKEMNRMGEFSIDQLTDPKFQNIQIAMMLLQDSAQESSGRQLLTEWLDTNQKGWRAMIDSQKEIAGTLGLLSRNLKNLVGSAIVYDVHQEPDLTQNQNIVDDPMDTMATRILGCHIVEKEIQKAQEENPDKTFMELCDHKKPLMTKAGGAFSSVFEHMADFMYPEFDKKGVFGCYAQSILHGITPSKFKVSSMLLDGDQTITPEQFEDFIDAPGHNVGAVARVQGFEHLVKQADRLAGTLSQNAKKKIKVNEPARGHEPVRNSNIIQEIL